VKVHGTVQRRSSVSTVINLRVPCKVDFFYQLINYQVSTEVPACTMELGKLSYAPKEL